MVLCGKANQSTWEAWLAATGLACVTACLRAYPLGQTDVTVLCDAPTPTTAVAYCDMARICLTDFCEHFICLRFPPQTSTSILFILFFYLSFRRWTMYFICFILFFFTIFSEYFFPHRLRRVLGLLLSVFLVLFMVPSSHRQKHVQNIAVRTPLHQI